uniref:Methanethiol oxidase n=1 Tax=Panagrellus redivivus TaxID=6233 RepID=A0A7E4V731_PANRE
MSGSCQKSCKSAGPGYATPEDAVNGPREKFLFVATPSADIDKANDALVTIDVDPESPTFKTVVSKLIFPHKGDEVHHMGWNACSSCHGCASVARSHLILPCLNSSRIYVVDARDPKDLKLERVIEPEELAAVNVSFPHTAHCLADGNIMISTLGDAEENNKADFVLIDSKTFRVVGTWAKENKDLTDIPPKFGYDFWYQPHHNIMISTEWGTPKNIKRGFVVDDVLQGFYGNKLNVYDWKERKPIQTITLEGMEGYLPLEVRFKHDPKSVHAFIGTALGSALIHVWMDNENDAQLKHETAIAIPAKKVTGWLLPEMPSLITDILISMDDSFLFISNWVHGDIRMYDIRDPFKIKLVGQAFIGGSIHTETGVEVQDDPELSEQPKALYIQGTKIEGGPQMLQLSLDGKRLYVTTSLYRKWDEMFYPNLAKKGATMVLVDVDNDLNSTSTNRLKPNPDYLVNFDNIFGDGITYLAHEMRYPGGDCTSDIFLAK